MDYTQVIHGLTLAQELQDIKTRLSSLESGRLKPALAKTLPFSDRLNNWLREWKIKAETTGEIKINFVDEDDFDENDIEGTFQRHQYFKYGTVNVWKGASEDTIFGSPEMNHIFRAWHDVVHFTQNLGFDSLSEIAVGKYQAACLPTDWWFEKALIDAEVTGQILYFNKFKEFPKNQRDFVLTYLKTGQII